MTTHHHDDSFIHSVEKGGNGLGKVAVASSKRHHWHSITDLHHHQEGKESNKAEIEISKHYDTVVLDNHSLTLELKNWYGDGQAARA